MPTVADLAEVEAAIRRTGARLAIVDPLMAHLPGEVNSFRDQDVRRVLGPIAQLAEETGCTIVAVRHLNKASGPPAIYRGGGSIGIIGAARAALLVAPHPDDPNLRVLASVKSNLGPPPVALGFRLEAAGNAVRLGWQGPVDGIGANQLLITQGDGDRSALTDAGDFLAGELANGPMPAKAIQKSAREAGIAERTLQRAKAALKVISQKDGAAGPWLWMLPAETTNLANSESLPNPRPPTTPEKDVATFQPRGVAAPSVDDRCWRCREAPAQVGDYLCYDCRGAADAERGG
jgi:hypothetical protein